MLNVLCWLYGHKRKARNAHKAFPVLQQQSLVVCGRGGLPLLCNLAFVTHNMHNIIYNYALWERPKKHNMGILRFYSSQHFVGWSQITSVNYSPFLNAVWFGKSCLTILDWQNQATAFNLWKTTSISIHLNCKTKYIFLYNVVVTTLLSTHCSFPYLASFQYIDTECINNNVCSQTASNIRSCSTSIIIKVFSGSLQTSQLLVKVEWKIACFNTNTFHCDSFLFTLSKTSVFIFAVVNKCCTSVIKKSCLWAQCSQRLSFLQCVLCCSYFFLFLGDRVGTENHSCLF